MLEGEDLGQDDIEAVASKFLRIDVTDKPVNFLKALGGKQGTQDWVDGDRIAAHALWLKQNRVVVPGGRFLVGGHTGEDDEAVSRADRNRRGSSASGSWATSSSRSPTSRSRRRRL